MITRAAFAIAIVMAVPIVSCQSKQVQPTTRISPPCTLSMAASEGFSGFAGFGASLNYLGQIGTGTAAFKLYTYSYVNPANQHGNHRLMVFQGDCRFVGAYSVSEPPVRVEGQRVFFRDTGVPGNVARFGGPIPPAQIWIDGDVVRLAR